MTSIRILPRTTLLRTSRSTTLSSRSSHTPPSFASRSLRPFSSSARSCDVEAPTYLDDRERDIFAKLQATFAPTKLEVQDVSGGCGSMYAVEIASDKFKGLPLLKQHRLVKDALGEDVKKWHGFQLRTKVPE